MSYFLRVEQLSRTLGVPVLPKPTLPHLTRWEFRARLLQEELDEYIGACQDNDLPKAFDALLDLQVILTGTVLEMGLQKVFNAGMLLVHEANMSKACSSLVEATQTVEKYKAEGIDVYPKPVGEKIVIYRRSDNKFLKSINWQEADLTPLLDEHA